eukprot:2586711-Prymnesium_polylepis.1
MSETDGPEGRATGQEPQDTVTADTHSSARRRTQQERARTVPGPRPGARATPGERRPTSTKVETRSVMSVRCGSGAPSLSPRARCAACWRAMEAQAECLDTDPARTQRSRSLSALRPGERCEAEGRAPSQMFMHYSVVVRHGPYVDGPCRSPDA